MMEGRVDVIVENMVVIFFRTFALYLTVLIVIRVMGKREVGQLSPFDLVVAIMIAETAAISMEDLDTPLIVGIVPIVTLMGAEVLLSFLGLKVKWFRTLVAGAPSIIINKGVIMEKEMRKIRYNVNDLLAQLRDKDVMNIADVDYAILETSGNLNIVLKPEKRAVTPADLNIKPPYEGIPMPLIYDGEVQKDSLKQSGKDMKWLMNKLQEEDTKGPEDVLFASLDSQGNLYISKKNKKDGTLRGG